MEFTGGVGQKEGRQLEILHRLQKNQRHNETGQIPITENRRRHQHVEGYGISFKIRFDPRLLANSADGRRQNEDCVQGQIGRIRIQRTTYGYYERRTDIPTQHGYRESFTFRLNVNIFCKWSIIFKNVPMLE